MKMTLIAPLFAVLWVAACDSPPAPKPAPAVKPAPAQSPEPQAEAQVDEAMKNALLGIKAPEEEEPKAAPKRVVHRRARPLESEEIATEEVDSSLSDFQFQSAVGNWRGVKACLSAKAQQAKPDDPTGALKVAFTISDHGDVVSTKVYDFSNEMAKSLADCVEREAKRVKFPAFTAAEPVVKEAKFVF